MSDIYEPKKIMYLMVCTLEVQELDKNKFHCLIVNTLLMSSYFEQKSYQAAASGQVYP